VENRAGQELFSVALKAGLSLFYVITGQGSYLKAGQLLFPILKYFFNK
jgi:hypothetical protein